MKCKRDSCSRQARPSDAGYCRTHYNAHLRQRSRSEGYTRGLVDATPVHEHLAAMERAGLSHNAQARLVGIENRHLYRLKQRPKCTGRTLKRVLDTPIPMVTHEVVEPGAKIDATGTQRRIQGMIAMGYSCAALARMLNTPVQVVSQISLKYRTQTTANFAERVASLAKGLQLRPGPTTGAGKQARNRAIRHGWVPLLAWDEDSIDDPLARPVVAKSRTMRFPEKYAEMRELGLSDRQIAERMNIKCGSLEDSLRRYDMPISDELRSLAYEEQVA